MPFGSTTSQSQTVQISSSSGASIPYHGLLERDLAERQPDQRVDVAEPGHLGLRQRDGSSVSTTPYTGTITVSPNNSDAGLYSIPITVSLTVTGATSTIYAGPAALLFSYQATQAVPPSATGAVDQHQRARIYGQHHAMPGQSNCPTTNWLSATRVRAVTPATFSVSVATTGMTAGFCTGTVIVTYNNGTNANTSVNIPVTVDISATPLLTVTPPFGFGVVTATAGIEHGDRKPDLDAVRTDRRCVFRPPPLRRTLRRPGCSWDTLRAPRSSICR